MIPLSIANYFKDEINGIYSEFFTTGKPKIRGSYVNGFRDGEWFIYHPNGQIEKKVSYRKDLEHAWAYTYDKNGVKNLVRRLFSTIIISLLLLLVFI